VRSPGDIVQMTLHSGLVEGIHFGGLGSHADS
jgi:hypothetical protein